MTIMCGFNTVIKHTLDPLNCKSNKLNQEIKNTFVYVQNRT